MRFFEYLKKQEPSKENEEARKRIYKLHQLEGSLTYIERMEIIEEGKGSKGKIIFEYWQPVTDRFWNSQYLKEFTLEK